jgi:glycosyltransferase involved in cell wall biosynthesis
MVSGERIRSLNLIRQLTLRGWRVSLFSLSAEPVDEAARRGLEELCEQVVIPVYGKNRLVRMFLVMRDAAFGRAFHRTYFWSRGAQRDLDSLLAAERFDAYVACQLYMAPYLRAVRFPQVVFDSVNAESRRLETIAASGPSLRSLIARMQLQAVRKYEKEIARQSARILAVSPPEFDYFERIAPARVSLVPNGVDTARFGWRQSSTRGREILFVGSLDYSANVDAVLYLLHEILPRLRDLSIEVTIVGTKPPAAVHRAARRAALPVNVTGFVESTEPYIRRARALVVPLRHGAGTRLKILEALACGLPVISTSVGCEGLSLQDGREVLVADEPSLFARAIRCVLNDDELCHRLSANGRRTVEGRYDWSLIAGTLNDVLVGLVGQPEAVSLR